MNILSSGKAQKFDFDESLDDKMIYKNIHKMEK